MYSSLNIESHSRVDAASSRTGRRKRIVAVMGVLACLAGVVALRNGSGDGNVARQGLNEQTRESLSSMEEAFKDAAESGRKFSGVSADGSTSFYVFPDMVKASENEEEIFGHMKNLEKDEAGFASHEVRVFGASGRYLNVKYRGRYQSGTYVHGLELHDDLLKFGCTEDAMVLEFETAQKAKKVVSDLSSALSNEANKKVVISGRQIGRCPKSREPTELLRSHDFGAKISVKQTRIPQTVRMLRGVSRIESSPTHVRLDTSFANLQDVFEDLDFSGETDMVDRESTLRQEKFRDLRKDNVDGILFENVEAMSHSEYGCVANDDEEKRRLIFGWISAGASWVVNTVVSPVVNLVVGGVSAVASFVTSVVGTIIQPVVKVVGGLVPVLVNQKGSKNGVMEASLNYNSATGHASNMLSFDTHGLQTGAFLNFAKTQVGILAAGRVACRDCYVRFYDGVFSWHVVIGGQDLGYLELQMSVHLEAMLELDADVVMTTQVTKPGPTIPIPKLAIPLGSIVLGFALAPEMSIGVTFGSAGFYVKYRVEGWQKFGVRASMYSGVEMIRDGWMKEDMVGPATKDSVTASIYLLPLCGLMFTNVVAVEAGVQPTVTFELQATPAPACKLSWAVLLDAPLVVGAWIGLKSPFGMWRLAGFSQAISLIPTSPVSAGCVTSNQFHEIQAVSGVAFVDAAEAQRKAIAKGVQAVKTLEEEFRKKAEALAKDLPMVKEFENGGKKWVLSNGVVCSRTCSEKGLSAVSSGPFGQGGEFYVCSRNVDGKGFRGGWNLDYGSYYPKKCRVTGDKVAKDYSDYQCLCAPKAMISRISFESTKSKSCKLTCESQKKYPLVSGVDEATKTVFYICGADLYGQGYRGGMNVGSTCASGWGSEVRKETSYKCGCVTPLVEPPPRVAWIASSGAPGCPQTCDAKAYFPVLSGSDGSTKDFYVCGFSMQSGEHMEGFMAVNTKLEYTPCYARLLGFDYESSGTDFRCLCTKSQSEYISWVSSPDRKSCSAVCTSKKLYPVLAHAMRNEYVCSSYSAKMGGRVAGVISTGTLCTTSETSFDEKTSFDCACSTVQHVPDIGAKAV